MNLYKELSERQQKETDDFLNKNAFFAFNAEQFRQGVERLKATESNKVLPFGAGGYMLTAKWGEYKELVMKQNGEREAALADADTGAQFAYDMFYYELCNHEYIITGSIKETLDCLGYSFKDIQEDETLKEALAKACHDIIREEAAELTEN